MLAKTLALLLVTAGLAVAETHTYLVKRSKHFPQDRYLYILSPQEYKYFSATGIKDINAAGGQPFRITSYEISPSGKYALWSVTASDEDERWHIESMKNKGYTILISSMGVVTRYDARRGGNISEVEFQQLAELPTDYYSVEVSTE